MIPGRASGRGSARQSCPNRLRRPAEARDVRKCRLRRPDAALRPTIASSPRGRFENALRVLNGRSGGSNQPRFLHLTAIAGRARR